MKIGIAGLMSLDLLKPYLPDDVKLPFGYPFPMTTMLVAGLINKGYQVVAYTTSIELENLWLLRVNTRRCVLADEKHTLPVIYFIPKEKI